MALLDGEMISLLQGRYFILLDLFFLVGQSVLCIVLVFYFSVRIFICVSSSPLLCPIHFLCGNTLKESVMHIVYLPIFPTAGSR
jgi:hypothetical protein